MYQRVQCQRDLLARGNSALLGVSVGREYEGDPKTDEVKLSTLGRFFSGDDDAKVRSASM